MGFSKLIGAYKNGNYTVHIFDDGTKIRKNNEDFMTPSTIESMDLKITNCCDIGCSFCFKSDTQVLRDNGVVSISTIKTGDNVLSYNTASKKLEYKPVSKLYEREYCGEMITIEDTAGNKITCTPNHKIYTNRGYIRADEIQEEDVIIYK